MSFSSSCYNADMSIVAPAGIEMIAYSRLSQFINKGNKDKIK